MPGIYLGDCPAEVADAITIILRESIIIIRMAGSAGDAEHCSLEAHHIHNLPSLLRHYNPSKLRFYLNWAQTQYLSDFRKRFDRMPTMFMPQWQRLEEFLKKTTP